MHRPGHYEDAGEAAYSMDRRKYLTTLAAGAALGTVAVGLAACGGGSGGSEDKRSTADTASAEAHTHAAPSQDVTGKNLWGYLRVFPPEVTKIADANSAMLSTQDSIRIPFYNNTGIDLSAGEIFGFTLLRIGCPAQFALAINLTRDDIHQTEPPVDVLVTRNKQMDSDLLAMGYRKLPWRGVDQTDC